MARGVPSNNTRHFGSHAKYLSWLRAAKYHHPALSVHPEKIVIAGKPYHPCHNCGHPKAAHEVVCRNCKS